MKNYISIDIHTSLFVGAKIRRPLGDGRYDYMIVGEYDPQKDEYEINLPEKPPLKDAIGVYAFISKATMIAQNYEVLS